MQVSDAPVRPRRTDALLESIAERLGARFTSANVFGTPVERDGVTVIPVAAVAFGFGAGSGADSGKGEGEGGGGGGSVSAVGYIELKGGRSRFVPIVRPERMVALMSLAALAATMIALRTASPKPARRRRGRLGRARAS
jgi:uncharacterized spore protein YtfJ